MRSLFVLLFSLFTFHSHAGIKTAVGNSGQGWATASNWLPSGIPQDGDIVIIPFGFTLSVKGSLYTSNTDLFITVMGTLQFEPSGKLNLGKGSNVQLFDALAKIITANGTGSELIAIDGVVKYKAGNDGLLSGPAFASMATGESPQGFTVGTLPIHLRHFTARKEQGRIVLDWQVEGTDPVHHFVVEHSSNGITWQPIQEVETRENTVRYYFTDNRPFEGTNYYRLKIVEETGFMSYSAIAQAAWSNASTLRVYQETGKQQLKVYLPAALSYPVVVQVVNGAGQLIQQKQLARETSLLNLDLQAYSKGAYYLHLQNGIIRQGIAFQVQ